MTRTSDPAPAQIQLLEADITRVLVMEDRAQVTREATIALEAGQQLCRLANITPLVADRTLRFHIEYLDQADPPPSSTSQRPKVLDVNISRNYIVKAARSEEEQKLSQIMENLVDQYLQQHDNGQVDHHARDLINATLQGWRQEILDRLSVGAFDSESFDAILASFEQKLNKEQELLTLQFSQEDLALRLERLCEELNQAVTSDSEYTAELVAQIWTPVKAAYQITVEYQVPCALWRPYYSAELTSNNHDQQVVWQSAGMVWQRTGENWNDVELTFSTARPTLGAKLPLLHDDLIQSRPKTEREKSVVEVASRDQTIQETGSASPNEQADTPPGLEDGGETRVYRVPYKVSVPADGLPYTIEIEKWETEAQCELVCIPEQAQYVFLRSQQTNPSVLPLLAGPVQFHRDGAFVGRGQIGYVAANERFALSWGSEDGLVVLRQVQRDLEETSIRKRKLHNYKVDLYLSNQTSESQNLTLIERIPISEIEQVEVEILDKNCSQGYIKDDQGFLRWTLDLQAGAETRRKVAFRISTPSQVAFEG